MDPFIGQICIFGFNYAPVGWAFCNGQQVSIQQNSALFALLGTTYGGNGISTFNLPNLQGRVPVHMGQGAGLPSYQWGQQGGSATSTLQVANLPAHTHSLNAFSDPGNQTTPKGNLLSSQGIGKNEYRDAGALVQMGPQGIGSTGSGQAFDNMPPYLALNFCIALQGIFPSRQ